MKVPTYDYTTLNNNYNPIFSKYLLDMEVVCGTFTTVLTISTGICHYDHLTNILCHWTNIPIRALLHDRLDKNVKRCYTEKIN